MNQQINSLENEKEKMLRDLYENGNILFDSDKILNYAKIQSKDDNEQINLLTQRVDEMNEERQNFTNLIKTDMRKIVDNIIQHLNSDNNNHSKNKAQELFLFYKSLINYLEEKTSNELMK